MRSFLTGAAAACATVCIPASVLGQTLPDADIDCSSLPEPIVYVESGDTQMDMLASLARYLRDDQEPITLAYLARSTCSLVENVYRGTFTTEVMRYVPSSAEEPDWDGIPRQCSSAEGGQPIDLGIAATFVSSCSESVLELAPDEVKTFRGPVQGYGFVVPEGVVDRVPGITREEAFFVFSGQGAEANAQPWVEEPAPENGTPTLYIRRATTSTLLTISSNVAPSLLLAADWVGYRLDGQDDRSSVVVNGVANAAGTDLEEATVGLLGIAVYDQRRDALDLLAYQGEGQRYGYYPDSTPASFDKKNLRDGHYVTWSYTEYLAEVDGHGAPVNADVERILDIVSGTSELRFVSADGASDEFDVDALEPIMNNGLVPICAMGVAREYDGGELSLYEPESPCGCLFEAVQDESVLDDESWLERCPSCTDDEDCETGKCHHGYCE